MGLEQLGWIAILALGIDWIFGELPGRHPVIWMGDLINAHRRGWNIGAAWRRRCGGLWAVASLGGLALLAGALLNLLLSWVPDILSICIAAVLASWLIGARSLADAVRGVSQSFHPQQAVAHLVSRDTAQMTPGQAYGAALESLAENWNDGVLAPLFWLLIGGLPGLLLFKMISTMDSMIGYRTAELRHYGWAAARADDLLNWIPARLTGMLILLAAHALDWRHLRLMRASARRHASPNGGWPIAALALVLDVRFGGWARYQSRLQRKSWMGRGRSRIRLRDLQRGLDLCPRLLILSALLPVLAMIVA